MGKSTISMAIFNSYVSSPEGNDKGMMNLDKNKFLGMPWMMWTPHGLPFVSNF